MTCELTGEVVTVRDGLLSVLAPIKMDSAAAVLEAAGPHVRAADCTLDLAAVPAVDSAALSVVLSLLRISREAGHQLSLVNAPAAFGSLAALYGVDDLLSEYLLDSISHAHV